MNLTEQDIDIIQISLNWDDSLTTISKPKIIKPKIIKPKIIKPKIIKPKK